MFLRSGIYVMFSLLLLLTLSLRTQKSHVWAKRYELKPGWTANNTWPPYLPISGSEGTYKPLFLDYGTKDQTVISSDDGMFCLAMYVFKNSSEAYYLTIVMGCNVTGAGIPVWIANRNDPCPSSYVLRFSRSYNTYTLYSNDNSNWRSPGPLGSAELQDSGNWVLYDNSTLGVVKWQSFDHPTDVLLPSQNLTESLTLYSRANLSSAATGSFFAATEASRFVLYLSVSSSSSQSYYIFPFSSCNLSNTTVTYKYPSLQMSSKCSSTTIATFEPSQSAVPNFLRLDNDGNLVSYTFVAGNWTRAQYFRSPCQLPLACGPYGLCTGNGQCQCLKTDKGTVSNAILESTTNKCNSVAVKDAPCNQNTARNNHFVKIQARYFSNISIPGSKNADDCKETCLDYCLSCKAYSYTSKKGCFILNDTIVGSFVPDNETEIFLKFRNTNLVSGSQRSSNRKTIIAVFIGLIVAAFVIVCMVIAVIKLMRRKPINVVNKEINKSLSCIEGLPPRFTCQEIEAATEGFSKKLGMGGFGSVYEGMLKNGKKVAVKRLEGTTQGAKQFVSEMATMANIGHLNIVRLCGFCIENNEQMLVYDFMSNGSLDHWLFGDEGKTLTWKDRVEIAIGTARGLSYLHEGCEPPILHLDVKPQNILLDENFVPKVADFGLARQVERDTSGVVTCVRGTSGYMAPEWIMHSLATKKCDIYGFGMVLLEVLGGRRNLDMSKTRTNLEWYFPAWVVEEVKQGKILEIIDSEIRAYVPVKQGMRFIHVALWCIQDIASLRPSMEEVVQMLEGLREVEQPPLSFHFPIHTQSIVSLSTSNDSSTFSISHYNMESVSMSYVNHSRLCGDTSTLIR